MFKVKIQNLDAFCSGCTAGGVHLRAGESFQQVGRDSTRQFRRLVFTDSGVRRDCASYPRP